MDGHIRITTLLIWGGWVIGSALAISGAVLDIDAGVTGILIVQFATLVWARRWFMEGRDRELAAFDSGRKQALRAVNEGAR